MSERVSDSDSDASPAEVRPARVEALVSLLGDENPKISTVAWEHLESIGESVLPALARAERESKDPRVRVQASRFLQEWSRREVFREWVDFCRSERQDLERGTFLIARTEYPKIDVKAYRGLLEDYASVLRERIRSVRTTGEALQKVSKFLLQEVGFRGNARDYYSPENSYFNRVLERKLGIPITLSVIVLLVARRLLIPVHPVGMPQHFLLKYKDRKSEVFLDAFHGGRLLTSRDCARFLNEAGIGFRPEHLQAVSDREILKRMLGNLLQIYLHADDKRRSYRVSAMLKVLE